MAYLSNAASLYLDDQADYLVSVENKFRENGWYIETTLDIDRAISKAISSMDIFICDQELSHISRLQSGTDILKEVRRKNKGIFLALYTAYHEAISDVDMRWFEENNVKIYEKTDDDIFLLSLENDYSSFVALKDKQSKIFETLKTHVVNHLKGVSNQKLLISIGGDGNKIPVEALIYEVSKTSPTGLAYIEEWLETKHIIQTIRQKNTHD